MFDPNDPHRLEVWREFKRKGLEILYEDNHVLVVNKPAGLLSQGDKSGHSSVVDWVEAYRRASEKKEGRAFVGIVHRLDRNVSGAMVVAKTSKAAGRLAEQFRSRHDALEKTYLAWVDRPMEQDAGELVHMLRRQKGMTRAAGDGDPDARRAELRYEVEARSHRASRVQVQLVTGIPHQIRCQMFLAGHPLVGDFKYKGPPGKRPGLHSLVIAFEHPTKKTPVRVAAGVPADLVKLDTRLGLSPPVA